MKFRSIKTTPSSCLNCGKLIDAASSLGHRHKPRPGDITICLYCSHIMAFTVDMKPRALTDEEMVAIAGDRKIVLAIEAISAARDMLKEQK